jgi:VanZ family protein
MTESRLHTPLAPDDGSSSGGASGGKWRKAFWAFAIAGLIFLASSRSYVPSPGITKMDDKFGHFGIYGLLGTLVCRQGRGWRAAIWSLIVVSAFGASDEWHQSFVPGRSTDFRDWVADTSGAALAIVLYTGWAWYRRLLETPLWPRRERVAMNSARAKIDGQ